MVAVNLVPTEIRVAVARRRHLRRWMISTAIAAAALLAAAGANWAQLARESELKAENERVQEQLAVVRKEVELVTDRLASVSVQIDRADALRRKRPWSGMIMLIGSCMPDECWLTSVATNPERPAPQAAPQNAAKAAVGKETAGRSVAIDAPRELVISGYAGETALPHTFVANLKATGIFETVKLESSQRESVLDGSYFRFQILCGW